jgi:lipopolysaccharide transport protein LptA
MSWAAATLRSKCRPEMARNDVRLRVGLGRRALAALLWIGMLVPVAGNAATLQKIAVVNQQDAGRNASTALAGQLAARLSERLASHPEVELVPANTLSEQPQLDSSTRLVRRVAFAAGLDALIVSRLAPRAPNAQSEMEWIVALRSGHSGGVMTTHLERVPQGGPSPEGLEALFGALLGDLGLEVAASPSPVSAPGPLLESEGGAFFGLGGTDADQPIEIESDELEFFSLEDAGRRLVFTRNVRVVQGSTMLTANHLEALYPGGGSQPDRLVARGAVEISQPERHARCERAVYVRAEERLTCEGRAELVYRCDIVRGNSIQFDLAADRARVIGAATVVINAAAGQAGSGCKEEAQ